MKNLKIIQKISALLVVSAISMAFFLKTDILDLKGAETSTSQKVMDYETLFKKDNILDIYIDVAEKDWESMLSDPLAEEYKSATVKVGDTTVENVGFRTKGNLTLRSVAGSDSDRYSFRIKLDKYVKGQTLLGLDEFVVNNMYSDASYMREYLSYEALRAIGVDVPMTAFANIYINGELFGFYLCVEAIDDSFLERSFGDDGGNLYKQEQGSNLQYTAGSSYDKSELKSGKDETKSDLKNFIQVLNNMPAGEKGTIESVLDVDSALKYIAANTVLGNYDSYNGNLSHNYYLYGQSGKFTVLPWDYNMSIAGFGGGNQTTIPIDQPVMGVDIKSLPLINNLLAVKEYKAKYYTYIKELLSYLENFDTRVKQFACIIRPYVKADPTKFVTMEQFEASLTHIATSAPNSTSTGTTATSNTSVQTTSQNVFPPNRPADSDQRPEMPAGAKQMPTGERPELPIGEKPDWEGGENRQMPEGQMPREGQGGKGAMGMNGNSVSIVTFIKERIENIKAQLTGSLSTTGNTTMTTSAKSK